MDIAFETQALRRSCINRKAAIKKFGTGVAVQLRNRLADLRSADSAADLVVGLQTGPIGPNGNTHAFDLDEGWEAVFVAHHLKMPTHPDGRVDWGRVSRVKIIAVRKRAGQ